MKEGYAGRINNSGQGEIIKVQSKDVPSHRGKLWLDGDTIYLSFPAINDIKISGKPPLKITDHIITFKTNEKGLEALEAVLIVRQEMLEKDSELLGTFAEKGTDVSAIMQLYIQAGADRLHTLKAD
jgi:hypothetical protein